VFFFFISLSCAYAQRDTLYLDSLSGDYVIRYLAHFTFVVDSAGRHAFDKDEPSDWGKKSVEFDSMVAVIFEPANKIHPKITCTVTEADGELPFCYAYRIENGVDSKQRLNELSVSFANGVAVADRTPSDGWHSLRGQDVTDDKTVPGSAWHWWGDIGLDQGRGWTVGKLASDGLPGIVPVFLRGKTEPIGFPDEGPREEVMFQFLRIAARDADCVQGWSLGPVVNSKTFDCSILIDSLLSYGRRSSALQWIWRDSVAKSVDGKLRILKRDVAEKKYAAAIVVLRSLLRELDFHRSRSISDEAYALFKYNVEYLSDQLVKAR